MSISSNGTPLSASTRRARSQRWQPSAWYRTTLRIDAARRGGLRNPLNGEAVGAEPHRNVAVLVDGPGLVERARDDVVQLRVHLGLLPEVLLEALHPFEVGDHDAAGVGEDVRKDDDALVLEDLVRARRDRAVRPLDDDLRLHLVGVLRRDHLLER